MWRLGPLSELGLEDLVGVDPDAPDALEGDPRMPVIARHALELWVPGPYSPAGYADLASVARWISGRLGEPGATLGARSALLDLKWAAELRAGALDVGPGRGWQTPDRHYDGG